MENHPLLKGYIDESGRFDRLPGKRQKKKLELMLQMLANQFDAGRKYSEPEVNEILNRHHSFEDPATLRRLLWGCGLIDRTRDGKAYWVKDRPE